MNAGQRGEDAVACWAAERGWTLLERNWRCPCGEIDLIAREGKTVVFVEVKSRSGSGFGTGRQSVGVAKQRRIARAGAMFLQARRWLSVQVRFDVVEYDLATETVTHIPAAFEAGF